MNLLAPLFALVPFFVPSLSKADVDRLITNYLAEQPPQVSIVLGVSISNDGYAALARARIIRMAGVLMSCYGSSDYEATPDTARIAMENGWYAPIEGRRPHGDGLPWEIEIPAGSFS